MTCYEPRRADVTAKPVRRPFQCAAQPWDAKQESPCHSTTTPYYKELQRTTKYGYVLQSTTPYCKELLRITKYYDPYTYYSVATPHCKKNYVLQNNTTYCKVLLRATKYYKVLLVQLYVMQL